MPDSHPRCFTQPLITIAVAAALLHGCSGADARSFLDSIGAERVDPQPPIAVDCLCDRTTGSSCGERELRAQATVLLNEIADRPGSAFRLWLVADPAATRPVYELTVPAVASGSVRQRRRARERFLNEAVDAIVDHASFDRRLDMRRSPLAESLTRIGGYATSRERHVVVISDLRERAAHDFECRRRLPDEQTFTRTLAARGLLLPQSLERVQVHGAFVEARPLPTARCASTPRREAEIARLWTVALRAAGATSISFRPGAATLGSDGDNNEAFEQEEP